MGSPRGGVGWAVLAASLLVMGAANAADLEVVVQGVAHARGDLRLALYADPSGFRKEDRALARQALPARTGDMTVTFPGLPDGRYAVIAYHDENADGTMNKFMGMIPTEGYGLTNNPEVSGPPQFDECSLEVEGATRTVVRLKY